MPHRLAALAILVVAVFTTGCSDGAGTDTDTGAVVTTPAPADDPEIDITVAPPAERDPAVDGRRVIGVEMDEFVFAPATVEVSAGEIVEFRFTNRGSVVHDAFVGTAAEQLEHSREMAHGDGHDHHGGNDAVTVAPGETASIVTTFDEPAVIEIGCHQPGHYEGGMRLTLTIV